MFLEVKLLEIMGEVAGLVTKVQKIIIQKNVKYLKIYLVNV